MARPIRKSRASSNPPKGVTAHRAAPTDPVDHFGSGPPVLDGDGNFDRRPQSTSLPSPWLARLIAGLAVTHFVLVTLSYLATAGSSEVQRRLLAIANPYLTLLHLSAEEIPLAISTNSPSEKTHRMETTQSPVIDAETKWDEMPWGGMTGGDRQRRWQRFLSASAELGESEQGAMVAWLLEPLAETVPGQAIRIRRETDVMSTVVDEAAPAPYTAAILREGIVNKTETKGVATSPRIMMIPPQRLAAPLVTEPTMQDVERE